jgi:hypothetical protein
LQEHLRANQEGKKGGSRKDAKEGKDSFFSREGRALRLGVRRSLPLLPRMNDKEAAHAKPQRKARLFFQKEERVVLCGLA